MQNFGTANFNVANTTRVAPPQPVTIGGDDAITLSKELHPASALVGDEVEILLTLRANDIQCSTQLVEQPVDVALVIDISTSMREPADESTGDKSKLDTAKDAALAFVENTNIDNMHVAVVVFDGTGTVVQGITNSAASLNSSIQNIQIGDSKTTIYNGLREAYGELTQYGRVDVNKSIILLSDGANFLGQDQTQAEWDAANAKTQDEANKAKAAKIRIISVGLGENIDLHLLETIASDRNDKPEIYLSPDASSLADIYVSIARQLREYAKATNLRVTHVFDSAKIQVIPAEISNQGLLSGNTVQDTVIWEIPALSDQPLHLSYKAILKQPGQFLVDNSEQVEYILCETDARTFAVPAGLAMQVQEPTPTVTPTNTPTPTPVPTSTPSPTITPTPGIFGAPTPTPEAGWSRIIPIPSLPSFCSNQLWWLSALVLPLLLILLLLLLLWWWSRRNQISWRNLWREWRWPCRILSLLLLLFLLLLAFLIGRELFVGACRPAEAVYFWRMDPQIGDSGIFLTTNDAESAPMSFKSVNRGRCVGCHAVSSQSHQIAAVEGPIPGSNLIYTLSGERIEIPNAAATYYAWSPDGKQLAYSDSGGDIYKLDLEAGNALPLEGASDPSFSETMPSWAPDGQTIAFVRSSTPLGVGGASVEGPSDIYSVPAVGGQPQMLEGASGSGMNYYPAYSPDAKWLAFTHHTTGHSSYSDDAAEIYLIPATGGEAIRLEANDAVDGTSLSNVSNSWPTWSQDGRLLAFNSKRNDPFFDVFITEVDDNGHSGVAAPLPGASQPNVFEHTPFWGDPLQPLPLWQRLLNLWPWLLPLLLLGLLRWLFCRDPIIVEDPFPPAGRLSESREPPHFLATWRPLPPEWDPAPTLVIGLGGTGRRVLTHLKKNLLDAGMDEWKEQVRLLLLDNSTDEVVRGQKVSVEVTGIELNPDEQIIIGSDLKDIVRRMANDSNSEPEMQSWFPADEYSRVRSLPDAQMDIRSTTNQRRPMGRALAFRDIQKGESSKLWQGLHQAMHALSSGEQVRVLIIGSLGGGFGSATLADVAYLVRRAAMVGGANTAAVITAFLATDNVFVSHTRSQQLKLNMMATLRELGRFLLARGRPFPMTYDRDTSDVTYNGFIEWSVFDDVFLFDGQRSQKPLTLVEPERGMFPLMADLAQAFIDQGSQLMDQVRANSRTTAATVQVERGEPVVSTLGAYTYRLPLRDIARGLTIRFAHDLIMLHLTGPEYRSSEVHLSDDLCQEEARYPDGLASMVEDFLRGTLYGSGEGAGAVSYYVADLAYGGAPANSALRALSTAESTKHEAHFRKALTHLLLQVLNGQPSEQDIVQARSGKLGYALAFMDELHGTLANARERAESVSAQVPQTLREGHKVLEKLIQAELDITKATQTQLMTGSSILLGSSDESKGQNRPESLGILMQLKEKLDQEKKWREEMRQIEVRKTLIDEVFVDDLYDRYFAPYLDNTGLESLYWRRVGDDKLELAIALDGWREKRFENSSAGREQFVDALLELSASLAEEIWRLRLDPFFDDREKGLWKVEKNLREESLETAAWAEPTATVRTGSAQEQEPGRYLWVNSTVSTRDAFARQMQLQTNMRTEVQQLNATDPYSAMLLTSLDILPLSSFDCVDRVTNEYRNAYGIGDSNWSDRKHSYPEPVHVFAAERHALAYEQRLSEIQERPRLFHPLFVAALEDLDRARTFVLAYALGWVHRERYQERGEQRERYVLTLAAMNENIVLTRGDHVNDPVALIVRALQYFVLGQPPSASLQERHSADELTELVRVALRTQGDHLPQVLREIPVSKPDDLSQESRLGVDDFWSFARLVALDELRQG